MSLFRSERMGYYNLVMPRESAWDVLNELGEKSCLEFIDQNPSEPAFGRPFSNIIKRCEEIEANLKQIEDQMKKFATPIDKCRDVDEYLKNLNRYLGTRNKAEHTYLEEIESDVESKAKAIIEQASNYDSLQKKFITLVEYKAVLKKTREKLGENYKAKNAIMDLSEEKKNEEPQIDFVKEDEDLKGAKLNYLAGILEKEEAMRFKRMVFRITKGNSWTYFEDVKLRSKEDLREDEEKDLPVKTVFIVVYQGGSLDLLKLKLNKLCESFGASKFPVPDDKTSFMNKSLEIENHVTDTMNLINLTKSNIETMLRPFSEFQKNGNCSYIEELKLFVLKEKTIYYNMNLLKLQNTIYSGYCWLPRDSEEGVNRSLQELMRRKPNIFGCQISEQKRPKNADPPTHFRLNDFTAPFQEIVNTYGIPRYREANPGLFTIVMFPFLFGVMFGDIGHGGCLFIFSIYLCLNNTHLRRIQAGFDDILDVRFLLLLMGFFAFYCGLIYNDFLSMPWNLFGTCFTKVGDGHETKLEADCVYPIGLDPLWYIASNELNFFNSLKMKLAVIIGVIQMIFGIYLKGTNSFHFSEPIDFIFEVIPQMLFMICTFGYMDALIFYKWGFPWGEETWRAPSIINTMINIPLKLGSTEGNNLYNLENQEKVQLIFLIIAVVCVPIMLFVKPILLYIKHSNDPKPKPDIKKPLLDKKNMEGDEAGLNEDEKMIPLEPTKIIIPAPSHGHEEFEMSEVFVHQIIETIEFVLGSISNTASYLRLWALSLAHSQLAKVFFEKTIGGGIEEGSFLKVFVGYFIFINITFGVLMSMDMMECFLHALRLQWVEFQNKFYKADGHKFAPFSFTQILNEFKAKNKDS